jgi:hypothetical protein
VPVIRVLLLQLDGKLPNVALMRVAAHHRALGNEVELRQAGNEGALGMDLWDAPPDLVYASLIFERTRPLAERLLVLRPDAMVGGTGWDVSSSLEAVGITTTAQDYSVYPHYTASIGFTQRGCRLRCGFCVVPKKEGANKGEQSVAALWRGHPWPKHLALLDNDFFGQPGWRDRVAEIVDGGFRVSFTQGINARLLCDDSARAIASMQYYDDSFKARRIYTAWDNRKDEGRLFAGLEALKRHGVKPDHVMVYMLIGYWPGETDDDRLYRQAKLRAWGARPYPMPFTRDRHLVGFQRWAVGAYDKRIPWADWVAADYNPRRLGRAS